MNLEINTANILKTIALIITVGGLLWGLSSKFNDSEIRDKELLSYIKVMEATKNILREERMSRMERTELYNRMNKILYPPASEDNYSMDRYIDSDYEEQEASKK